MFSLILFIIIHSCVEISCHELFKNLHVLRKRGNQLEINVSPFYSLELRYCKFTYSLSYCVCVLPELFSNAALCLLYYALDKMGSLSCFVGHTIGQLFAHTCPLDDPRAGGLSRLQHGLSLLLFNTSQPDTSLRAEQSMTYATTRDCNVSSGSIKV